MGQPFRILSLTGGGVRGVYQAIFLQELAPKLPGPFKSNFELISGTSTGSIIAAALACDIPLEKIAQFYEAEAGKIFDKRWVSGVRPGPHYQQEPLAHALRAIFGKDRRVRDCVRPLLLIPSTTLTTFKPRIVWNHDDPNNEDLDLKLWQVILASCAAPTYFEPVQTPPDDRWYVDGGLWANSPCLISAIYAHTFLGIQFQDMRILNVRNGSSPGGRLAEQFQKRVPWDWRNVKSLLSLMFDTQAVSGENVTKYLVTEPNVLSIDDTPAEEIELDDVKKAMRWLPSLARERARSQFNKLAKFLTKPPPLPPQPQHAAESITDTSATQARPPQPAQSSIVASSSNSPPTAGLPAGPIPPKPEAPIDRLEVKSPIFVMDEDGMGGRLLFDASGRPALFSVNKKGKWIFRGTAPDWSSITVKIGEPVEHPKDYTKFIDRLEAEFPIKNEFGGGMSAEDWDVVSNAGIRVIKPGNWGGGSSGGGTGGIGGGGFGTG
ncbi:MAG TPA: CBASS cGAMP-activated phospholipase [Burkholderiales bacterium]|nr:CBASS cGAMP-activated phospholipase [Burkholderiales bacterium]